MTAAAKIEQPVVPTAAPGGPGGPLIALDRVSHVYRSTRGEETQALADVSLTINPGEFVCLLGPSGCGKTTLLNMIAGFVTPSSGEVRVSGRTVYGPSPDRGVVFQDYSLFPWLTVAGNVAFGPRMAGRASADRTALAAELIELVGLTEAAERYPAELSGGMKQRAAIARALATDPDVLLMDEPFAALDAMTRAALQKQLVEIHARRRKTVLFVTHNIAEAITLASRVVVLSSHPGRVVADWTIDLARPRRRAAPEFGALYARIADAIGVEGAD